MVRKVKKPLSNKRKLTKKEEFKQYLAKIEDPNYRGGSWALPENATTSEKVKYGICEKVIKHKRNKQLTTEQLAQKIKLSPAEVEDILYCRLDCFTLDCLLTYTDQLFSPSQLKITIEEPTRRKRNAIYA